MTKFQEYLKRNPKLLLDESFKKFKELYPELDIKEQKKEFNRQINDIFFNRI